MVECVQGLLGQSARPQVLVVDDGSSDRTADLVRELQPGEPRLRLAAAGPLPAGWVGKVHALGKGAELAATPWLLTTDADTRHAPELLARALTAAVNWNLDALSLAGRQQAVGLENLVTPPVYAVLDLLLGDWRRAARGQGPAVANGQFILLRASALEAIGGFAAVRGAALDDVALARALRAGDFRTGFARAPELLAVRMYSSLGATWSGWRRNLGLIFGPQRGRAAAVMAALALPAALLLAALATGHWLAAGILWSSGVIASAAFRHGQGQALGWALLYPADAVATAALLARAVLDYRRGRIAAWKGRPLGKPGSA